MSIGLFTFALAVAGDGALPISLAIKNKFRDCVKECKTGKTPLASERSLGRLEK